ncbi:phage antirepressor KilAC domain-containing protein [Mycolicibacterium fortuitum]|uniref:Phage antirepressor KilAC domain-containing protein n=1 Tax=Mycolicibacterium fortuitum TaxID=1766 RepID=A0AAE4V7Y1_MYCFO|nr:phage antirepressor KilAC domain-containing protein [Mycolicibacterium fortuitum]MDV7194654.1 phage antirepressor KilAC domain-containing protein [Mycolicibacterium fortuitum]MDV7208653.1 phage antirepressor KilAC domain-containing protein [Mycolicibacterium fortuitum]MDV7230550.1 phage antirepressor KilAC domain-containing protein [Mycolicibacterium fortuitum]MDV7261843.1 phage antirepressor KilAC domain-containing protein [Mycolicibacterium fortuitum]MDV7287047.1 phage antirepressor KilAC
MSEIDHISGEQSPFDTIRRVTPEGREWWSARELMPLLGYSVWRDFANAIGRARAAAQNSGHDPLKHFAGARKVAASGPAAEDFHLSRFACYLIAMNGDPRKPEIAAAQTYFAIKTREAETRPALPDITTPEGIAQMAAMFNDTAQKLVLVTNEKKCLEAAIERDAPLVAKAEAHSGSDSDVHRQEFAREVQAWGVKQNLTIKQADVLRFLGHIGLFIRGERTDTGHATADAQRRGLAFTHKDTARNGYAYAVGKLTPTGQDYAWKRITKYVADHGTLELPRELRGGEPA